eukprot:TRINITY_DN788_c0_g1_i1.p1 TRINITY_DN788_c0_g1~~TRINITY_DN788_c0_g1_i1.p1  ORF type:complete len:222 (+),score=27.57 TRINITY_DN788_c0_g1_i1:44-667(+)
MGDKTFTASEVVERPGSFGLTYCIPIKELPSLEFYDLNSKAGKNTFRAVLSMAWKGGDLNVKVTKQQQSDWKMIQYKEWAYIVSSFVVGGTLGMQVKVENLITSTRAERLIPSVRQCCASFGVLMTCLVGEHFRVFNPHTYLCEALSSRTPLGDYARATFDDELSKDLGRESSLGLLMEFWSWLRSGLATAGDSAVPGSFKNIVSNV